MDEEKNVKEIDSASLTADRYIAGQSDARVWIHSKALESGVARIPDNGAATIGDACLQAVAFIEEKGLIWPPELEDMKAEINRLADGALAKGSDE